MLPKQLKNKTSLSSSTKITTPEIKINIYIKQVLVQVPTLLKL